MARFSLAKLSLALLTLGGLASAHPAAAQNLFVGGNGYIEQFTHGGTDLGVFYVDPIGNHMGHTSGLTFDPAGNLLVISDSTFGIVKLSPTGAYLGNIGAGATYTSIAADAFGNVYAANSSRHTVDRFSASGASLGTYLNAGSGITVPSGLAFDRSGNLYVSNSQPDPQTFGAYLNKITKYAPNGSALGVFTVPSQDRNTQSIGFNNAGELLVGQFNDVGRNGIVRKFSPTGTDLGKFNSFSVYDPLQFAFDNSGNVFVDDNGGVLEYDPSGNVVGQGPGGRNVYMSLGISASGIAFAPSAPSPVPEAATTVSLGLLLALGLGGLTISRHKRSAPKARPVQCVSVTRL